MSSSRGKESSSSASSGKSQSLLVMVLDVSPLAWGDRDLTRTGQDKARAAAGKRSVGPVVLQEMLESAQAFASAFGTIERESGLVVMGVADNETAVLFPRKDALAEWLAYPENYAPDLRQMRIDLVLGVSELVARASQKAQQQQHQPPPSSSASSRQAAMASAFSSALCLINRFLVAARAGGVSALQDDHFLNRSDDDGVVALIGTGGSSKSKKSSKQQNARAWSPRILLVQASEDRSRDYNAFMNGKDSHRRDHHRRASFVILHSDIFVFVIVLVDRIVCCC